MKLEKNTCRSQKELKKKMMVRKRFDENLPKMGKKGLQEKR